MIFWLYSRQSRPHELIIITSDCFYYHLGVSEMNSKLSVPIGKFLEPIGKLPSAMSVNAGMQLCLHSWVTSRLALVAFLPGELPIGPDP